MALSFNGISYAVMMATPADLEDFMQGFAIGEGIVSASSAIYDIEITQGAGGTDVNASVSNETAFKLKIVGARWRGQWLRTLRYRVD